MRDLQLTDRRLFVMMMDEGSKQVDKWGVQDRDAYAWVAYATEEMGELAHAVNECVERGGLASEVVNEAVQTATLALKIAEMFLNLDKSTTINDVMRAKMEGRPLPFVPKEEITRENGS